MTPPSMERTGRGAPAPAPTSAAPVPDAPASAPRTWGRVRWSWILIALGIIVLAGGAGIWYARRRSAHTHANTLPAARDMATMPGSGGMAVATNGAVILTAAQLQQFGVTFGTADVRPLVADVRVPGVVTIDERRVAQVAPKFAGYAERLYVNATGQPVRRGQPLLEIYSPDLVAAQQELLLAGRLARDVGAGAVPGVPAGSMDLVAAAKERLRLWDVSETQIDEILRSGRARRTVTLYAPVSGVVTEKHVVQGQATTPGGPLYTIADLSVVWVEVEVRETDAANLHAGSPAAIEFASFPGRPLAGRVEYVYPMLQPEARTLRARITVPNGDGRLRPGMYATVHLSASQPAGTSALTVPASAVLRTGDRNVVFVDLGHGALAPRDVELGRAAGGYIEVLAGLEPRQRVVTSAQFLLDSESNLGEVMRAMMSQMGSDQTSSGSMGTGGEGMSGMQDMQGMTMPPTKQAPTR